MSLCKGTVIGLAVLVFCMMADADVIDPGYHPVDRCVTIANGDEFPDIELIGAYKGPGSGSGFERYIVRADSCLTKGYKFSTFKLFWVEKTYLEIEGLENLPLEDYLISASAKKRTDGLVFIPMGLIPVTIEPYGGVVPDSNPVTSEKLVYKIVAGGGGIGITVYLAEKTVVDKDGEETKETFTYNPTVTIERLPTLATHAASLKMNARLGRGFLTFSPGFSGTVSADLIDCQGRPAMRFTRECRRGCTYLVHSANLSAGVYWLKVKRGNETANIRLDMFE